jgi:hypothetical protein
MLRAGETFKADSVVSGSTATLLEILRLMSKHGAIIVFMTGNLARLVRLYGLISLCFACGSDGTTGPTPPGSGPQIDIRYLSTLTPSQQNAVTSAAEKWMRALSKNLGDFRFKSAAADCFPDEPALDETHHNLLLFISVGEIDGPGGQFAFTSICGISSRDTLPVLSRIRLDRADVDSMEARGILQSVILHEMGHALGFNPGTYVTKGLSAGGTGDPVFVGVTARSEFAKHGAWYTGVTVPLENTTGQGPRDPHWRLSVFGDELMVSVVGRGFKSPLSSITLGFFKDIGYNVDFSVADPYEVAPFFPNNRMIPEGSLRGDFVMITPPSFVSPVISR